MSMGIYIKGMEMPTNCRQCSLYLQSMDSERNAYENCAVTAKSYNWGLSKRPSDCPLVPVPPHGRLIEKETILDKCYQHYEDYMYGKVDGKTALLNIEKEIKTAPTIIEAEEVDDERTD